MAMDLIAEEVAEQPRLRLVPDALERLAAAPEATPRPPRPEIGAEVLAALKALGSLLTVRLMLLLAVIGAFILARLTLAAPSESAFWVLGIFNLTVVGPLVWLSQRRT